MVCKDFLTVTCQLDNVGSNLAKIDIPTVGKLRLEHKVHEAKLFVATLATSGPFIPFDA